MADMKTASARSTAARPRGGNRNGRSVTQVAALREDLARLSESVIALEERAPRPPLPMKPRS